MMPPNPGYLSIEIFDSPEDDTGEEGVAVDKHPEGQKTIVMGKRFAVEKGRREVHDSVEEQRESQKKLAEKIQVKSTTQATWPSLLDPRLVSVWCLLFLDCGFSWAQH